MTTDEKHTVLTYNDATLKHHLPVSVVSPVFNNEKTIASVLDSLFDVVSRRTDIYQVLLIDDGSIDKSKHILHTYKKQKHVTVLFHKKNRGIAYTYRELYKLAKYEHIVLFSLDNEWDTQDIGRLLDTAWENKSDIVIGKREKKQYSLPRLFVSRIYNILTKLCFGVTTYDAGSIKYIKKSVVSNIPIVSKGVFDEAERIIRAAKKGYKIDVIPVHHKASKKTKTLRINVALVNEAFVDLLRVFFSVR